MGNGSNEANDEKVCLILYREEVDTLISMTSMSIEIEQEMDEAEDHVLSWLLFIRANLKAALGDTGCDCDCDEDDTPPPAAGD